MTRELTTKEAAEFIAKQSGRPMSPVTVRALCREGRMKARKHGTGWAIDAGRLSEFERGKRGEREFDFPIKTCGKCQVKTKDCNGLYLNVPGKLGEILAGRVFVCNNCCGLEWKPSQL